MTERQIINILKKYKIPFVDPCDEDYEGDCICPTELVFPEAVNICDQSYPAGTTILEILDDICDTESPTINAINGLTDTQGGVIEIKLGGPLTEDTDIDGQLFNFTLDNLGILTLEARTTFNLRTPEVFNGTRTPGQVLVLQTIGGEVEFADVPGDDWGTQVVISDATLTGDGTIGSPLSVVGGGGGTLADNGLYLDTNTIKLGGTLVENTQIIPSTFKLIIGQNQLIEWDDVSNYLRIAPDTAAEASHVRGAMLFKKNAAGGQDHVEYSTYGMPVVSPTTFGSDYFYRWNADGTGEWVYRTPGMNGLSTINTGLVGSTESIRTDLGGDLIKNTTIDLNSFYLRFYQSYSPNGYFQVAADDSLIDPYFSSFYIDNDNAFAAGTVSTQLLHTVDVVSMNYKVEGSKLSEANVEEDTITIRHTGSGVGNVIVGDGYVRITVPEYASDGAADGDANLPSGSLYRITGTRDVKYKP